MTKPFAAVSPTLSSGTLAAPARGGWASYENRLLAALSAAEASMFIDRLALGILTPFVVAELHLSNLQLGLLASVFSVTYALAGFVGGLASDRTGRRRAFLIVHIFAFSVLSALTGFSSTFAMLLAIRFLLGLAEGPVLPLLQSVMLPASSSGRRAFNAAFLMNVAPFIVGQFGAPIILTHLAAITDWRVTFFMTAVPGFVVLPFIVGLVRDPVSSQSSHPTATGIETTSSTQGLFRNRNLLLCLGMASCTGTWVWMFNTFLPLYLVKVSGYSTVQMGYLTSLLGIGGCLASLVLPTLSDRIGRKPVLLVGFALGAIGPLCIIFAPHELFALIAGVMIGSCILGITPLTITLVPSDSVPNNQLARAIGLTSAASAIIGGMVMTTVAGRAADLFGLQAAFVIALAACFIAAGLALLLQPADATLRKTR